MESKSFDQDSQPEQAQTSVKKWTVLAVFCASNFLVSLNGFLFAPIATTFEQLYGVGANEINLISIVSLVMPFILLPVAMYFVDKRETVEEAYYIGMSANMVCSWIRYFVPAVGITGYIVAIVTQALISLTHPFLIVLPPRISAIYFPLEQRNIATSLGTICGLVGLGLGMILSPLFINDVQNLFLLQSVASTIPLAASLFVFDMRIVFQCKPKAVPVQEEAESTAASQKVDHEPFRHTLFRVLKDFAFLRLLLMIGVGVGAVQTWITLVNQAAQPSFDDPTSTIIISALFFCCGILGTVLTGVLCDKTGDQILVGRWMLAIALIPATISMVGWYLDDAIMVYVGFAFTGLLGFGLLPLAVELGVEYAFSPNANCEATVCGLINFVVNIFSAILIIISTPGNIFSPKTVPLFWEALFIFTVAMFFTLPKRYLRQQHQASQDGSIKKFDIDSERSDAVRPEEDLV